MTAGEVGYKEVVAEKRRDGERGRREGTERQMDGRKNRGSEEGTKEARH